METDRLTPLSPPVAFAAGPVVPRFALARPPSTAASGLGAADRSTSDDPGVPLNDDPWQDGDAAEDDDWEDADIEDELDDELDAWEDDDDDKDDEGWDEDEDEDDGGAPSAGLWDDADEWEAEDEEIDFGDEEPEG